MYLVYLVAGFVVLYSNYRDINYDKKLAILYSRGEDDEYKYVPRKEQNNQYYFHIKLYSVKLNLMSDIVQLDVIMLKGFYYSNMFNVFLF
ncbi:Hypothetical protein ERGA_CDS_04990 [Ehrlichia ruminantium str. Gardel]|uniref:hypothetical protein n=1 Tax=Ehrlichia ruminantium TaxID=779 RepID=UPI00004C7824|nr:hypothetical protein [Ehrlichia ruminantium]CAI27951.1 Hypothetical protein ERGA_CDS_04990 [Ehrlichia ruminantium str. Gardel]